VKSEICSTGGVYSEMSVVRLRSGQDFPATHPGGRQCRLPGGDAQASAECAVPTCTLCNSTMGLAGGQFMTRRARSRSATASARGPTRRGSGRGAARATRRGRARWARAAARSSPDRGRGWWRLGRGRGERRVWPARLSIHRRAGRLLHPRGRSVLLQAVRPRELGVKSETCAGSVYAEMSGCTFDPAGDYACYKIRPPPTARAGRNSAAEQPCSVAPCTLCNSAGGTANGTYTDSAGVERPGYCVCAATGKWSCVAATSWPCPAGAGC
jgi:hypothetical protein